MRYVRAHTVPYSESSEIPTFAKKKKKADSSTNMLICNVVKGQARYYYTATLKLQDFKIASRSGGKKNTLYS